MSKPGYKNISADDRAFTDLQAVKQKEGLITDSETLRFLIRYYKKTEELKTSGNSASKDAVVDNPSYSGPPQSAYIEALINTSGISKAFNPGIW